MKPELLDLKSGRLSYILSVVFGNLSKWVVVRRLLTTFDLLNNPDFEFAVNFFMFLKTQLFFCLLFQLDRTL